MKSRSFEIDMCNGPLMSKLLLFSLPLMASGILQLLFNAVDVIVVGRFTGNTALAAVGSTTALINIFVTLFVGISLGTNVLAGKCFAMKDEKRMSEVVHTAIALAMVSGVVMIFVGILVSKPALTLMSTPDDVIGQAVLYMRIYFVGMPFFMVYNFGAAVLRSVGDTRRPLIYLIVAGLSNVALNLFLVLVFHMGVAGVAIGTVVSQALSGFLVMRCLMREKTIYQLRLRSLHINRSIMLQILRIGIPAGLQSMMINLSNALIQSSINSFGTLAIAGNTAANNLNGFLYMAVNSVTQAALSFTSQNSGVGNYKRISQILTRCIILEVVIGTVLGNMLYLMGPRFLSIYSADPDVASYGMISITFICVPYALCGVMDMIPGCVRGMGYSTAPMAIALIGVVLFRFFWIFVVFPLNPTLQSLYISYPVSWVITTVMQFACYFAVRRRVLRRTGRDAKNA